MRTENMHKPGRWLAAFALLLMVWGQFLYACDTMDMPPQASCCCDDGVARCEGVTEADEGCVHANSGDRSGACCSLKYSSPAEDAITLWAPDHPPGSLFSLVALLEWPSLEAGLLPGASLFHPSDPDWLLAQASAGRAAYLSTLRLRI